MSPPVRFLIGISAMKSIIAFVFLFLALQASALGSLESDIPQANRVILTTGQWTPTVEETQKALIAIQSFLERPTSGDKRSKGETKNILANIKTYRVQFVGHIRQNRRVVWCNFFTPHSYDKKDRDADWKRTEIIVSDGWYWYWQIDYDPATGKCLHFWVNGMG
jgi:hypothetical protein